MITRRRLICILAGAASLPLSMKFARAQTRQWRGVALGANAQIILDHPNARELIADAVKEIERLENIFSLYRPGSQLSNLNRDGMLREPAFELVELLSICSTINSRTKGAFDPTIQPLWSLYAERLSAGKMPDRNEVDEARALTGFDNVSFSANLIGFGQAGMALTLNGVAQGYIADRVSQLLRNNGVSNVLVNTGEIAGIGTAPNGQPWPVKLKGDNSTTIGLSNAAIATSAPLGTVFDPAGSIGHIIDPRTGQPGGTGKSVSVMAPSAATADGLSTAFCLMNKDQIRATIASEQVWFG